ARVSRPPAPPTPPAPSSACGEHGLHRPGAGVYVAPAVLSPFFPRTTPQCPRTAPQKPRTTHQKPRATTSPAPSRAPRLTSPLLPIPKERLDDHSPERSAHRGPGGRRHHSPAGRGPARRDRKSVV